jgi:hypothetical protein
MDEEVKYCPFCSRKIKYNGFGRPPLFCSKAHKIKFHNKQRYIHNPPKVEIELVEIDGNQIDVTKVEEYQITELAERAREYGELLAALRKEKRIPLEVKKLLSRAKGVDEAKIKPIVDHNTPEPIPNHKSPKTAQIKERIAQLEQEIANPIYTNFITKKMYIKVRENELEKLKAKINL